MGLLQIFNFIVICPILYILRWVTCPVLGVGQWLQRSFVHRHVQLISNNTTPGYGGSSPSTGNDHGGGNKEFYYENLNNGQATDSFAQNGNTSDFTNRDIRNRLTTTPVRGPGGFPPMEGNIQVPSSGPVLQQQQPAIFHAINVPSALRQEGTESSHLVFRSKEQTLKEMKKYKGSRFKSFSTQEAAIDYTQSHVSTEETNGINKVPISLEKSLCKAPRSQELINLRKLIENGDHKTVKELITSNPRYLVSSGDTPTILHEGTRYNALHVAAKNNRPQIVNTLLQSIQEPRFLRRLYGLNQDDETARVERLKSLLDFYLNTPDKGSCETPLHFACKFGHKDVVKVLVDHPLIKIDAKNKFEETPLDLICRRADSSTKKLENEIKELFEGRCYVPLYRDEDNMTPPRIGTPCSPVFTGDITSPPFTQVPSISSHMTSSPLSPRDTSGLVKAYVGPMSPTQADDFRKKWRSPCSRNNSVVNVVRTDQGKGYERIGRLLAQESNVVWNEYWPFLETFTDLSKTEGHEKLESYLQKQFLALNIQNGLEALRVSDSVSEPGNVPVRLESLKKNLFASNSSETSTNSEQKPLHNVQKKVKVWDTNDKTKNSPSPSGKCSMSYNKHRKSPEHFHEIMETLAKDFATKLVIINSDESSSSLADEDLKTEDCTLNCLYPTQNGFTDMMNAVQDGEAITVSFAKQPDCDNSNQLTSPVSPSSPLKAPSQADTIVLNVCSPNGLSVQIPAVAARSPPKVKNVLKIFLQGCQPTKLDLDVFRCLQHSELDSEKYPYTYKWLQQVKSFSTEDQNWWPSPGKGYRRSSEGTPPQHVTTRFFRRKTLFDSPS